MDPQLIELETRIAFQDDTLLALNKTVARQERMIEDLRLELMQLRNQLLTLMESPVRPLDQETPPPHY